MKASTTITTITIASLMLALAGCEKGSGTTNPDEAAGEGEARESDAPEEAYPDDEDAEDEAQPY